MKMKTNVVFLNPWRLDYVLFPPGLASALSRIFANDVMMAVQCLIIREDNVTRKRRRTKKTTTTTGKGETEKADSFDI